MKDLHTQVKTLRELKESGWKSISVKDEIRKNLIAKMKTGETLFEGVLGYEKTVLPQVQHAILSRHDMILLGLRGQAKTKMLRMLVQFLDEYMPIVEGSEINDDPLKPLSRFAKDLIDEKGDDTPIAWVHRSHRYGEKLATPDTTVADLIGDIDPIKAATQKLNLANENAINFGLIPRTNRGIFVINELPDLQPRIQVALLNIMQERDIQIRGFNVRIPLDISMAFSANPEDYTNRGNIITPLKDRIDAQIITHYPKDVEIGINITKQEAWDNRDENVKIVIPEIYREILEQAVFEARESEYIDQKSGISARMSISAMEQLISAAERRAIINGETETVTRLIDLYSNIPALTGKLELVYEGEQEGSANVAKHLIGKAIRSVFLNYFDNPQPDKKKSPANPDYETVTNWFSQGNIADFEDMMSEKAYRKQLDSIPGLKLAATKKAIPQFDSERYVLMEFVLEGLHQYSKLGKQSDDSTISYKDMIGSMLGNFSFDDDDLV